MNINSISNIVNSGQNLNDTLKKIETQAAETLQTKTKEAETIKPQRTEMLKEEETIEDPTEETGFDVTA